MWEYLTRTEKISEWFPEIKVGNLEEQGYMIFKTSERDIHMPVSAFEPEVCLYISDDYDFMDRELVKIFRSCVYNYIWPK